MDENYNPTDAELYALFGEEPPKSEAEPEPEVPWWPDGPPPAGEQTPPVGSFLTMADLPPFDDDPFGTPEPARGSWAQPPTVYIGRNNMPPNTEKPQPDTPAAKEPRKALSPGDHVTVVGYVFAVVDEEKRNTSGKFDQWRFHRTVWQTECRAVRCMFIGWTQMQGGWRQPAEEYGGGWDGDAEYVPPSFEPDKYVNVAVVMPLDLHDKSKYRKPFRCLPSQMIVESGMDFLLHLGERNRKFNQ